jgi:hypothetical protein
MPLFSSTLLYVTAHLLCISSVTVGSGPSSTTYMEKIPIIDSEISLWTQESIHSSRYPFQFVLPSELPPSFYYSKVQSSGAIKYYVEVVGKRPGLCRFNRRIRKPFSVVPAASPNDIVNKTLLTSGWNKGWRSFTLEDRIRKWPWGGYSHIYAEVCRP